MSKSYSNLKDAEHLKNCILAFGHFDSIHPGHLRYLRKASSQGNKLVIALLPDTYKGLSRNFQLSQSERAEVLSFIDFIDGIILLKDIDNSLLDVISYLEPNLFVLGKEFEDSSSEEIKCAIKGMMKLNKSVKFHAGDIQYSSTKLLENPKDFLLRDNINKFKFACEKQELNLNSLLKSIDSFEKTRILVIGDTILDQYAGCEALGISAEAPIIVVKELQTKNFIGGAAFVASQINSLGAECHYLSVVGNDDIAIKIKSKLNAENINHHLICDESRPTTFKKRYIVDNQKIFRVSKLSENLINKDIEKLIISKIEEIAPNIDGIVLSDFVYGAITRNIIDNVLKLAEKYKFKIFGDLQCSSQVGLVTKFKNFTLLSPNEKEARIALQDKESGLETISKNLLKETNSNMLIMKLGDEGLIAYEKISSEKIIRQSFPALCVNPVDVTGAGDVLLAGVATSLCSENNLMASVAIGSCMAALAVENMGNKKIQTINIKNYLIKLLT